MNKKIFEIILLVIITLLITSCSTTGDIKSPHKSEQAFLAWWKTPHYKVAAFMPYDLWIETGKTQRFVSSNKILGGTEKIFRVLVWDENKWFLVLSQDHSTCKKQRAWIVQLPEYIWTTLNPALSYELCRGSFPKYSDVTESEINFYWFENSKLPIIEIATNGPACTSYYLYGWNEANRSYEYLDKKCD